MFRVVCLGDSSTFGMNVDGANNYPRLLAERLDNAFPGRFEVINLGVPGYTGRQGLELPRRTGLACDPDLVTFGFGTNDRLFSRPLDDDAMMRFNLSAAGAVLFHLRQFLDHLYLYRLAQRAVPYVAHWSFRQHVVARQASLPRWSPMRQPCYRAVGDCRQIARRSRSPSGGRFGNPEEAGCVRAHNPGRGWCARLAHLDLPVR